MFYLSRFFISFVVSLVVFMSLFILPTSSRAQVSKPQIPAHWWVLCRDQSQPLTFSPDHRGPECAHIADHHYFAEITDNLATKVNALSTAWNDFPKSDNVQIIARKILDTYAENKALPTFKEVNDLKKQIDELRKEIEILKKRKSTW